VRKKQSFYKQDTDFGFKDQCQQLTTLEVSYACAAL